MPNNRKINDTKRRDAGRITTYLLQLVYERNIKRFGRLSCYLCGLPVDMGKEHLEHKIPICRGGRNNYGNLDIACASCNHKKNTKTEKEFSEVRLIGRKEKARIREQKWRKENKERIKLRDKKYREKNKEKIRIYQEKYRKRTKRK
jgi:5-methylcytosine-specific restriction endonuclease McrA